jgi:hypothetical protein
MKEKEPKIYKAKNLIKTGAVVSGIGTLTIIEAIATSHGELGPLGLIIGATGATMILAGKRRNKI